MRKLALHASALSDTEYGFFTKSLREIIDDETQPNTEDSDDVHFEKMSIGVREARAWFRGRYSRVFASVIDGILKLFSPNLGQRDTMTGPEFFAALRLVIHAENGKDIDRSLAFVQVDSCMPSLPNESRLPSPPRHRVDFIPLRRPFTESSIVPSAASSPADFVVDNPFSPSTRPQQCSSHGPGSTTPAIHHSSFNPFLHGNPPSDDGSGTNIPPLPPRKLPNQMAAPPAPPRQVATRTNRLERSLSPSRRSTGTSATPLIPPKPSQHVTSTLIKQSLQASKVAQTMKKAEEQLEKERVMQVLKSSSVVSGAYPLAGASVVGSSVVIGTNIHNQHQHQYPGPCAQSPSKFQRHPVSASISSGSEGSGPQSQVPPLPKRRTARIFPPPSQQPSPPPSESSLEQVALASPQHGRSRTSSHEQTNSHFNLFNQGDANHPLPAPPPTHPDRKLNFGYQQLPSPDPQSPPPLRKATNLETFEAIYGSMSLPQALPSRSANGIITSTNRQDPSTATIVAPLSPNAESPATRASRSQSLIQPTVESTLPPPPIRINRPESIQSFSSSPGETLFSINGNQNGSLGTLPKYVSRGSGTMGHRKSSLSLSSTSSFVNQNPTLSPLTNEFKPRRSSSGASSVVGGNSTSTSTTATAVSSNIQRTIEALHSFHGQLQPKLEKARYKAEAGFSRRGYVRGSSVHASAESSPARADVEEKEHLTRGYNTRGGRWRNQEESESFSGKIADLQVDRGSEGNESDGGDEYRRGRSKTASIRLHNRSDLLQYTPRNVFDDSPERDAEEFDGFGRTAV